MSAHKAPITLTVTKAHAAQSQLEAAIWLWFTRDDPISILGLAHAANDCYVALGGHAGKSSVFQSWLKTKPQGFQKRAREVQNFIKHGRLDLHGKVRLLPKLGENLIMDSIHCYEGLFGDITHLMQLFRIRFWLENPDELKPIDRPLFTDAEAEHLKSAPRAAYLQKSLELLRKAGV